MRVSIRLGVGTAVAAAAPAVGAGPALVDAGAWNHVSRATKQRWDRLRGGYDESGTAFPEGQASLHMSDTAASITTGVIVDAGFGG